MRKLLHVADHSLELEVTANDDGLTVTATAHTVFGAPIICSVIPWAKFRQEDNPNAKYEGQSAPAIATIDEAHTFSEDEAAQAHEGRSRDTDRQPESRGRYE